MFSHRALESFEPTHGGLVDAPSINAFKGEMGKIKA